MKTPSHISKILATLPSSPGVYIMKNKKGVIIYVGKSVSLHSRVSSYWGDEKRLNFAKRSMISQVQDIEIIETRNELEALVLETNLIKENQPKYNILMKDGKNLAYIHITNETIPEVIKTRIKKDTGFYFGPYTAGANVTEILKVLKRIFQIRSCRVEFIEQDGKITIGNTSGRSIPCLDYSIGLCPAPCLLTEEKIRKYEDNIASLKQFLSGKSLAIIEELRARMQERARKLEFEEAQKLKLQIEQIEKLGTRQIARDSIPGDYDAIISIEKYGKNFIGLTEIRSGHIIGVSQIEVANELEETSEEVLSSFLAKRYLTEDIPTSVKILLKKEPKDIILLDIFMKNKRDIEYPQIGPKMEILQFAEYNLLSFAQREEIRSLAVKDPTRGTQVHILERLGYEAKKSGEIVFECYDISHTHGQFTVASRAVIVNGKSEPSRYRKYKIKSLEPGIIDDFASIREVLYRRTLEGLEQNNFPDMIIIDGGKGQLSSALEAMNRAIDGKENITLPFLCSLAKREEEVFIPGKKDPILFEKGSLELMLFQKIRDESHRFAIGFNRISRNKAMKKNILEELPGFGPVARKNILKIAGSIERINEVPRAEIEKILTKKQVETLEEHGLLTQI
ncbi:MAG: excinuclease ABC subunit UvrC [Candidatus Gracilibacteria bacterium]|nr:excinuclease ABC subunit UvrC [Candidatus Gracilibacteria bacterium]